jgi:hypothetical protein
MINKKIAFIITLFSFLNENTNSLPSPKEILKYEILSLCLRIFLGIILLSLIIISLNKFLVSFERHLQLFPNSINLELLSFFLITLFASTFLFLLFYKAKAKKLEKPFDSELIARSFLQGLSRGLKQNANKKLV